jgi:tRNA G10  N-methylase Trm11
MPDEYIFFLGQSPELSLAELEARFGADIIQEFNQTYAILKLNLPPNIDLLGGTIKTSKIIKEEPSSQDPISGIKNVILEFLTEQKLSKLKLGISLYSCIKDIQLNLKDATKILEDLRRPSRKEALELDPKFNLRTVEPKISTPKSITLNTAQIVHGGLLKSGGLSLDIILKDKKIILAETLQVPNLRKYTLRDKFKPNPDGKNGMLPPKLAQIMLSLSGASTGQTVLDPFCGSGTVLQESLLLGLKAVGTDLNPNIILDANKNIDWLAKTFKLKSASYKIYVADATTHSWPEHFDTVVMESYLGKPLKSLPKEAQLQQIVSECDQVLTKFLKNIYPLLGSDTKLIIAAPIWYTNPGFIELPLLDNLTELGYNQIKFKVSSSTLIYHRANQLVGRRILVLTKS